MKPAKQKLDETPRPETTRAILVSAGIHKPTSTIHFYKETRRTSLKNGAIVWEHIFQCHRTGAMRRWGIEDGEQELN